MQAYTNRVAKTRDETKTQQEVQCQIETACISLDQLDTARYKSGNYKLQIAEDMALSKILF